MRPSSLLRTISCKLPASFSHSPVTPWPPARTAFDRWLTSELDELRSNPFSLDRFATAAWLSKALDLAVAVQHFTTKSIAGAHATNSSAIDRKMIDNYLDDDVELLDACNGLRERMDAIKQYVDRLSIALHWLEGEHEPSETSIKRAREALELCQLMEKRCSELEKCRSNLRRLGEKLVIITQSARPCEDVSNPRAQLHEVLSGSRMVALLVAGMLGIALSFKPRRGIPSVQPCRSTASWMSSLHELQKEVREEFDRRRRRDGLVGLDELDAMAMAARSLGEIISRRGRGDQLKVAVDVFKRRCEEMERRVWPLEGKLDELYRQLIGIRVALLGMLTVAC
ncbi:protein BPS1, chloroplastic-like [Elaeis guineensis]|uniref:protein BPS1, chloroplastic-like n=1 Tax=Elaeis guineensis var. tenera TaxID=51953 RepID=UPI003C6D4ACC